MKRKKGYKLITRTDVTGWLFVLPFLIGFIWMFMIPLVNTVIYSFHRVTLGDNGFVMEPLGWENYRLLLFGDAAFIKALIRVFSKLAVEVVVIMFLSIFLALLLSKDFPGRLFFRAVLFLPVIFNADQVMSIFYGLPGEAGVDNMVAETNSFVVVGEEFLGFIREIIHSFGVLAPVIEKFTIYSGQTFNLLWSCGIQIILFIVGIQAIPGHLYEVAEMEGATKWEVFWKITFPLLTPSMLLCLIYTIVEYFNSGNGVVLQMNIATMSRLDYYCAMSIFYSIMVLLLVLIVYKVMTKRTIYLD